MTVTTPKLRIRDDRYMEQKKSNSDNPTSNPSQQVGFHSTSSTQDNNLPVSQTSQSKKLSVTFLLNSPQEDDDQSPLQQVYQAMTVPPSDKFTYFPSSNYSGMQSENFQKHHEEFQNTLPTQQLSNDLNTKRLLHTDSDPPTKRTKSERDNFIQRSNFSPSFPPSIPPLQPSPTKYNPTLIYNITNPILDLANLQQKSLPSSLSSANNNTPLQELLLAASTIEGSNIPTIATAVVVGNETPLNRRQIKYLPAPKNSPGPPNGAYFDEQWMMRYQQLKKFKNQYGHTNVTRTKQEWRSLGNWVCEQRRKVRAGKLTEQQFQLLDNLGFEWDRSYYFRPGTSPESDQIVDAEIADISSLNNNNNNNNNNNHNMDPNTS